MVNPKIKYDIYNSQGEEIETVDLNPAIFGVAVNQSLIHQSLVAQLSNSRQVLAHTKDRAAVRGGGRKPWRQKGTGRARHGSSRSPIWIGGGTTFGPTKERNYSKKINKKMKHQALFMALSDRVNNKDLVIIDKFVLQQPKTKEIVNLIKSLQKLLKLSPNIKKNSSKSKQVKDDVKEGDKQLVKFNLKNYKLSILIVVDKESTLVIRAAKNIPGIKIVTANSLNILDILAHRNLLLSLSVLDSLEKNYLK